MLSSNIKRKPKKISRSSFACWELSRVNSFCRSCFTFFRKTKTPKIFQCVSLNFFSFYSSCTEEKTTMKMLSGSHMNNCWTNKEPILPCLLLLNKMFADSNLVHDTLALLFFHIVRSCKWKAIMTIFDELVVAKRNWYELDLFRLCKYV